MTRKITDEEVAAIRRECQKDGTVWTVDAALRAEIARLQDERAAAFTRGVEAMREAAAKVAAQCASERGHTQATMFAAGRPEMAIVVGIKGGEASRIEELIRALKVAS